MCPLSLLVDEQESSSEQQEQDTEQISQYRQDRALIFHLLYAMEMFDYDVSLDSLIDTFNRGFELSIPFDGEIARIVKTIIEERNALDEQIKPLLSNWRLDRIGVCTKLILRMAIWELHNSSLAHKIIINEAIELAKCFSERDAYKFVNGVLDEALKRLAPTSDAEQVE